MFERAKSFILAVWARLTKQLDLPKFRPMESLPAHLEKLRLAAAKNYGPTHQLQSEAEMRQWLAIADHYYFLEIISWKRGREYKAATVATDSGTRALWSAHEDTCRGWENSGAMCRNGANALVIILDTIDHAKHDKPIDADWATLSWSAEACGESQWLHYHLELIQQDNYGSFCSVSFHFFVSDVDDLMNVKDP